jgi:hypothetical protein
VTTIRRWLPRSVLIAAATALPAVQPSVAPASVTSVEIVQDPPRECFSPCNVHATARNAIDSNYPNGPFSYEWDFDGPLPLGPVPSPPEAYVGPLKGPFAADIVGSDASWTYRFGPPLTRVTTLKVTSPDGSTAYQFSYSAVHPFVSYRGRDKLRLPVELHAVADTPGAVLTWRSRRHRGFDGQPVGSGDILPIERTGPDPEGNYHFAFRLRQATYGPISIGLLGATLTPDGSHIDTAYLPGRSFAVTVVDNRLPDYRRFLHDISFRQLSLPGGRACALGASLFYVAARRARHRVTIAIQRLMPRGWTTAGSTSEGGGVEANFDGDFSVDAVLNLNSAGLDRRIERSRRRGGRWRYMVTFSVRGSGGQRAYEQRIVRPLTVGVGPRTCGRR